MRILDKLDPKFDGADRLAHAPDHWVQGHHIMVGIGYFPVDSICALRASVESIFGVSEVRMTWFQLVG